MADNVLCKVESTLSTILPSAPKALKGKLLIMRYTTSNKEYSGNSAINGCVIVISFITYFSKIFVGSIKVIEC